MKKSSILDEISEQTLRLADFVCNRTEVIIMAFHRRTPGESYKVYYVAQVGSVLPDLQFPRETETGNSPTEAVDNLLARLENSDYGSEERAKIAEKVRELGFRVTRH